MIKDIVLICDDNYTLPTAVCITSVVRNSAIKEGLRIHVCSFSLTEHNQQLLKECGNKLFDVQVHLLDFSNYKSLVSQITEKSHVSKAALIKFELPNIFSKLDSLLYIDSDIIIRGDLTDLLCTNLSNNYIAASYEFWRELRMRKYEYFKDRTKFFFNSGVMLLNLKKMREDNITEKLWDYKINRAITTLMDQESFNVICSENTIPLSIKWNFNPIFKDNDYIDQINARFNEKYQNSDNMFEDVRIIHYVGKSDKPWLYKGARYRKYWDECYDRVRLGDLCLKDFKSSMSTLGRMKDVFSRYGIMGYISLVFYKIERVFKFITR